jgi:hypothetical protein
MNGGSGSGLGATARGQAPKGEDNRGQRGQSATMQTAPKFGPLLHHRGQRGQNVSSRWAGFFLALVKNELIRTIAVRMRRAIGDALIT